MHSQYGVEFQHLIEKTLLTIENSLIERDSKNIKHSLSCASTKLG
jgi:hypothetical protein